MAEADPKLLIKLSKIKNNRLLERVQMIVNVYYDPKIKVTREQIKKKLVETFKKPHVSIFGLKKVLGGGRTKCFCLVYDSDDSLKKYEPKCRLARMELEKKPFKERKFVKTKEGRKIVKVRKHQLQRKRATKRRQEINLQRKQKKKK
jgi:small subunit ribosomal protein S24e